jgi:hypothetical protein
MNRGHSPSVMKSYSTVGFEPGRIVCTQAFDKTIELGSGH